jgi:hypothetical protein
MNELKFSAEIASRIDKAINAIRLVLDGLSFSDAERVLSIMQAELEQQIEDSTSCDAASQSACGGLAAQNRYPWG